MVRGEVYFCSIALPRRFGSGGVLDKLVLVLQGGDAFEPYTDVAVLVASSYEGGAIRPFEVLLGTDEGFDHETVIDGRWPFTLRKSDVLKGKRILKLTEERMHQVSVAIVKGLQLL